MTWRDPLLRPASCRPAAPALPLSGGPAKLEQPCLSPQKETLRELKQCSHCHKIMKSTCFKSHRFLYEAKIFAQSMLPTGIKPPSLSVCTCLDFVQYLFRVTVPAGLSNWQILSFCFGGRPLAFSLTIRIQSECHS